MKRKVTSKKKEQGSIMLPFWGFAVFLPINMTIVSLMMHVVEVSAQTSVLLGVLVSILALLVAAVGSFVGLIALGIYVEVIEWQADLAGLSAADIWKGKNWLEKILRELFRLGIFFGGLFVTATLFNGPVGDWLRFAKEVQYFAWFAIWQLAVIALFYCIAIVKKIFPRFGGFAGDPQARFHHAW